MVRTDFSELTVFIAIAEAMSFRAAARRLGVSPSALSHAVRNLEAKLKTRLFNRTTRSVALTEAGELLLRRIGTAVADIDDAMTEVASMGYRPSGVIRISAAEAGARLLITNVLPEFLATYPDIHVEIVVDTRLVDIVAEGFDAGIRLAEDVPRDMIAIPFGPNMRFAAVASPAYLSRHDRPKTPDDLASHHCIRFRFSSGALYRWNLEHGDKTINIDVHGPMTLGNTNLMVDAALAGIGIAWVPDHLVGGHLVSGKLVHVLPEWSPALTGPCIYYPANRHPPTALRLFTNAVRDWASRQTKINEPRVQPEPNSAAP